MLLKKLSHPKPCSPLHVALALMLLFTAARTSGCVTANADRLPDIAGEASQSVYPGPEALQVEPSPDTLQNQLSFISKINRPLTPTSNNNTTHLQLLPGKSKIQKTGDRIQNVGWRLCPTNEFMPLHQGFKIAIYDFKKDVGVGHQEIRQSTYHIRHTIYEKKSLIFSYNSFQKRRY